MNNSKLKPALIGGVTFGVLSSLPLIEMVNVVCCALYIGGGVLAVYLHLKDAPPVPRATYGDGAVVGLLAGLFGAVAVTLTTTVVTLLGLGENPEEVLAAFTEAGIELPEFVLNMMGASGFSFSTVLTTLVTAIILYGIFATIGGLLGVAIFRKKDAS